ncbi:MAG: LacI family DNA-binding transcriptional regulator [Bacillota bacterium]|nr:LacI family DNA-binding transcriptional regulator [Bacillota bacterium]HHU60764.1 LacI family transcriptional regulator [Natronincola sp.]
MKTIKDIAELAGVSPATVSKVINGYSDISEATRNRVMKIVRRENFQPNPIASGLSGKSSRSIGIFLHCNPSRGIHHAFMHQILFTLRSRLGEYGYDCVIFSDLWLHKGSNFLHICQNRRVDGAVLLGVDKSEPGIAALLSSDLPSVFIDSNVEGKHAVDVIWDHYGGGRKVADYLYELGHYKIGLIKGYPSTEPTKGRTAGFLDGLRSHGLEINPQWIFEGDFLEETGYNGMGFLLKQERIPTAVFCQSDSIAVGAMQAAEELGFSCPEDISIIGYDDIEVCRYMRPRLTTIRQDTAAMGETVADILLDLMNHGKTQENYRLLPVDLITRESCRRLEEEVLWAKKCQRS